MDSGSTILPTRQTSLVVDPPDGRVPVRPDAEARRDEALRRSTEAPEFMSMWDRCISRGVPGWIIPAGCNNAYQIVQTPGYVVIHAEMIHDARIIPLDVRPARRRAGSRASRPPPAEDLDPGRHASVAVFGATGLIGEGILSALLGDPDVRMVHVVTRRRTPELDAAAATGRATLWLHTDFSDYAALRPMLAGVDAVYWALGTSAFNVSSQEYSEIHVDYRVRFVTAWFAARGREAPVSFHLVSGSGGSDESWFHWAREKARAERTLSGLAAGTRLQVVAYRPGGILRTGTRARWYTAPLQLLRPLKRAIEPTGIGEAMLEVTARGSRAPARVLESRDLFRCANAHRARRRPVHDGR